MHDQLMQASKGLSMVVIAGMTDANALVDAHPALASERIKTITVMGGVDPAKDADGYVQPDSRAYNNATDLHAARGLYRKAQQLRIPLRIVTKEAAYKTAVSPSFYEGLARSGHSVGTYLKDVQKNALNGLWDGIQAGLLPGLDEAWFFRTFTADALPQANRLQSCARQAIAFDQVWPRVTKLKLVRPVDTTGGGSRRSEHVVHVKADTDRCIQLRGAGGRTGSQASRKGEAVDVCFGKSGAFFKMKSKSALEVTQLSS